MAWASKIDQLMNEHEGADADEIVGLTREYPTRLIAAAAFRRALGGGGDMGPQGPQGEPGPQGPKGDKGDKGDTGADSTVEGPQGPKGDTGDRGPAGTQGEAGPQGVQGTKGDKGDTGATGPQGPEGAVGPQGPAGPQGSQGTQGPAGLTGATGATGAEGPQGPSGPTGSQGPKGDKGDKGDTGSTGPQGQTGPQGPAGADANASSVWPVGSVFLSVVSTNPATLLGVGTWSRIASGRMLVGQDGNDTDFDVAEETGGAKTVTLTANEMPSHTHVQNSHTHTEQLQGGTSGTTTGTHLMGSASTGGSLRNAGQATVAATAVNQNTGGGAAHNNMSPYFVVYMWKRTA